MALAATAARCFLLQRSQFHKQFVRWSFTSPIPKFGRSPHTFQYTVGRVCIPREFRRFVHRPERFMVASEKQDHQNGVKNPSENLFTLPTMLTVSRVVAVPVLIFVYYSNQSWSSLCSTGIFVAACLTDWLDGYIARKMKLASAFGAFLDPVADKLMVATALVLLCSRPLGAAYFVDIPWLVPLPAALMISREIIISAVREWAAIQGGNLHKVVAVDKLGKLKTATQMVSLTLLLAFGDAREGIEVYMSGIGVGLLYASTGLSLWSLSGYMRRLFHHIRLK